MAIEVLLADRRLAVTAGLPHEYHDSFGCFVEVRSLEELMKLILVVQQCGAGKFEVVHLTSTLLGILFRG